MPNMESYEANSPRASDAADQQDQRPAGARLDAAAPGAPDITAIARGSAARAGLGADAGSAGIDTKDEAMSNTKENEFEYDAERWKQADRVMARLITAAVAGLFLGAIAGLWI